VTKELAVAIATGAIQRPARSSVWRRRPRRILIPPWPGAIGRSITPRPTASGTLTAVADTSYLYGTSGELADPCYGLFTFRSNSGGVQQDVFVTFLGKSAVFSSFSAVRPAVAGETYDYFYGVGLAQAQ
jgi:hypothetical protein